MDRVKSDVEKFITEYEDMSVEVSSGVSYNLRDVINENYKLYNARFSTGDTEESGFVRIFMRKIWVVYRTLIQGSDIDLKDLNVRSINGVKIKLAAIFKMLTVSHLSRTFFGEFVDEVLSQMCWFGTCMVKRVDGTVKTVDLRNYITEPNIQNPQERRHCEMCYYTYDEVLSNKEAWKENWEDIERIWTEMQKEGTSKFKILEFWTWETKDGKVNKVFKKYLDNTTFNSEFDSSEDWQPYVLLETLKTPYSKRRESKRLQEKLGDEDMFPYEQFDLFKIQGRAISMGCGELLAGTSELYNELYSNKRKLDLKALTGITVHNAVQGTNGLSELTQDFIANLMTGSVITLSPGESLTQLPVDVKGADFAMMEEKIYELMRQIIGITAQGTGEEMPASTSATQAAINQQVANTVFDFTRERMQHGIKRLFNNGYSDDIVEELDEKELAAIVGDPTQLQEVDAYLIDEAMNKWALDTKNATGMYPTQEEYIMNKEAVQTELMDQGDMRFPEFKKQLLKDMDLLFEFSVTQEAFNTKLRSDALLAMQNDPESTKSKAKIEDELLSLQGLNPRQYDKSPEELQEEQLMAQQQQQVQQQSVQAPSPVI